MYENKKQTKKNPLVHTICNIRVTKNMKFQKTAINKLSIKIKENPWVHITCGERITKNRKF